MNRTKFLLMLAPSLILSTANASYYMRTVDGISFADAEAAVDNPTTLKNRLCNIYSEAEYREVCKEGVDAAVSIANQYGAGEGAYLGCVDGYQEGINKGYLAKKNDTRQYEAQAKAELGTGPISAANKAGEDQAKLRSTNSTEDEIIRRFKNVVRDDASIQPTEPSREYRLKVPAWGGVQNAYNKIADLSGVPSKIKNGSYSMETKLAARALYNSLGDVDSVADICTPGPILFNKTLHAVSIWDLFSASGEYNFKDWGWKSTNRAWTKISRVSGARNADSYNYHSIKSVTRQEPYIVGYPQKNIYKTEDILDPVTNQPTGEKRLVMGADGGPIKIGTEDDKTKEPIMGLRDVTVSGMSKTDLQRIYKKGFMGSYENLSKTAFAKAFKREHELSRKAGHFAGNAIGALVAKDIAKMDAYNAKFEKDSLAAYSRTYKELYKTSFNTNFDRFLNSAMVEVEDFVLVETDGNKIMTRGEWLIPQLGLVNLGFQDGKVSMSLSGDIDKTTNRTMSIAAPKSLRFSPSLEATAQVLASAGLGDKEYVTVSLSSSNMDQTINLNTTMRDSFIVNDVAEIHGTSTELAPLQGEGAIYVNLKNPSNEVNIVTLEITMDHTAETFTSKTTTTQFGAEVLKSKKIPVSFEGIDPLDVYSNGGISGKVVTKVAGRIIDSSTFSKRYNESARESILADYFFELLTGKTKNSGDELKEDRIVTMSEMIQDETLTDINRDVNWGSTNAVNNTVLGKILKAKRRAETEEEGISPEAQNELNLLAVELNGLYNRAFGYDDYHKLLSQLSSVDVEEIGKKQRKGK